MVARLARRSSSASTARSSRVAHLPKTGVVGAVGHADRVSLASGVQGGARSARRAGCVGIHCSRAPRDGGRLRAPRENHLIRMTPLRLRSCRDIVGAAAGRRPRASVGRDVAIRAADRRHDRPARCGNWICSRRLEDSTADRCGRAGSHAASRLRAGGNRTGCPQPGSRDNRSNVRPAHLHRRRIPRNIGRTPCRSARPELARKART
jgi:hypothetical protein